ncbi:hypothetical protein P152DRAFT_458631 [Eremomyces bilateralis CBS 781.70]|uniref:Uncharacterized protein n=1 Tax=Eremomyces bilateralis CBS 781.70 TaxID=1392243 RepID=A0A6G1G2J5_9PEZI|nr:uncharacterized protein P152DRAFT_458631 [Eremomyces bilateralis CBS 781.70]KAF1812238.1 hypothetical protein P152DRAFT_458631 [Eremomyces bilateralis CBS 781.70]
MPSHPQGAILPIPGSNEPTCPRLEWHDDRKHNKARRDLKEGVDPLIWDIDMRRIR